MQYFQSDYSFVLWLLASSDLVAEAEMIIINIDNDTRNATGVAGCLCLRAWAFLCVLLLSAPLGLSLARPLFPYESVH